MNSKVKLKKNDTVKVIAGQDKGKQGKILEILPAKNKALVEGVNMVSKHTKPNTQHPQGGIIPQEAAIDLSNLMLVDAKGKVTRIGRKVEDGKIVRYSKKSGEVIK
jgi:large subunit ribosomal protein L24